MREVAFIKQNKEKWLSFEQSFFLNRENNPETLSRLYIEIVNDLAYAQTFYPNSKTKTYLNELAARAYLSIYKTKRVEENKLKLFFKTEVPFLAHRYRKQIYFAFLVFFLFVLIGVVSTLYDDRFVRLILGDAYVNKTLENIANGDPVAIYKSGSNWGGFFAITINNIRVSFMAFILGVFGGLGTVYILMFNGIMLGSFQTMFWNEGVLLESMRGIWIHGAMEIFAIVISGAAGLILGKGILFPKTYSWMTSFKMHFRDALKLLISTAPFFVAAGFLEGYITRYSNKMPNFLSVGIILITLAIISYYYLIYPFRIIKKSKQHEPIQA